MPSPWIVVVDDERDIIETVTELLRLSLPDARIVGTVSPKEVLGMARDGIDLLVTDFRMPVMDGLELAREVHRVDEGLAVILITAYADDELDARAVQAGIRTVIRKPLNPAKFLDAIRVGLSR